ncbi:N-acetylmuramidase domain-containing protein [Agrobacterium rosae]|uniref:N-acetylmuramidase domain-containing protein n=1 Tax=Agrobacterium rosae TaxID=1972867 RepID=UPI002A137D4F|nr:N-acetylmuramidase domain-containing protein [Agrobacterium rosae]MDX8313321.1 N-acetylmuramidase domain-containing protein [Agrobacterium rosae]
MLKADVARSIEQIANAHAIDPNALKAVVEVESNGVVFAEIEERQEPVIRFEGHYFDKLVKANRREDARRLGLASPNVGGVKNPSSQKGRWELLARAMSIDKQAALESVSWGVGQVMGSHWKALGYSSVVALMDAARGGVEGQVDLMVRFIKHNNLLGPLNRRDWSGFARGYNGPSYKKNAYDTKMAAAYTRYSGMENPPPSKATGMLRLGSKGEGVREVQALLNRAGFSVKVDGDFGTSTDTGIRGFQEKNSLNIDGVAGPETMRKLKELQTSPDENPGVLTAAQVPEVKTSMRAAGPLAMFIALREQVAEVAANLTGMNVDLANTVANGLLAASGAVGIGLTAYSLYGLWQSKKTVEQA